MNRPAHAKRRTNRSVIRLLLTTTAVFTAAIVLALVGTGASYALWSGKAVTDASTVSAGTTALTVNDSTAAVLTGLDTTKLAPGRSVIAPVLLKNTGSTKLAVTVASTTVTDTRSVAAELTLVMSPVTDSAACVAGLTTGASGPIKTFSTTRTPMTMVAGAAAWSCLEIRMADAAPSTVQGGTTSFTINLAAVQVR